MRSVRVCRRGEWGILRGDEVPLGLAMGRLMGGGELGGTERGKYSASCLHDGRCWGGLSSSSAHSGQDAHVKSAREVGIHSVSF